MTDADALQLIERYRLSWYADRDSIPASRICPGGGVAILRGNDLVKAMVENADESREDARGTKARYERAQRDGLFDVEAIRLCGKATKAEWLKVAQTVKGDYVRAKAELEHWRDYARWAMSSEVTTLRNPQGVGALVRGLAEHRSGDLPSPASMPITDAERNEGLRRIEAQIEQWRAQHGEEPEPDRRLPPERDPYATEER